MIVAYASSAPTSITLAREDEPHTLRHECPIPTQCNKNNSEPTTNAVKYKLAERYDEEVDRQNAVEQLDEILKTDSCKGITVPKEYYAYIDKLFNMLTKFESMWDGHLNSIKAVPHQIELEKTDERPLHSVPYGLGSKEREFDNQEVN